MPQAFVTAVADEEGLRTALLEADAHLELTRDLYLTEAAVVDCAATLDGRYHTLRRATAFTGPLFLLRDGGALTLQKITLDGYRARTAPGGPLILILSGTLTLGCGAVLQNNHAANAGGAVRLETGHGGPAGLRLLADSVIRDCQSDAEGGGVYAQFSDPVTPGFVRVAGSSSLCGNAAMAGGALAVRHQNGGLGLALVECCAQITENMAAGHGGGIYYVNEGEAPSPVALRLGGGVRITGNRAAAGNARGGGVYLRGGAAGDRLIVGERALISGNAAHKGGGLCLDARRGGSLLLTGGTVAGNRSEAADDNLCLLPPSTQT